MTKYISLYIINQSIKISEDTMGINISICRLVIMNNHYNGYKEQETEHSFIYSLIHSFRTCLWRACYVLGSGNPKKIKHGFCSLCSQSLLGETHIPAIPRVMCQGHGPRITQVATWGKEWWWGTSLKMNLKIWSLKDRGGAISRWQERSSHQSLRSPSRCG